MTMAVKEALETIKQAHGASVSEVEGRILDLAEAVRPGSRYIARLSQSREKLEQKMELDLIERFQQLGEHVAIVSNRLDGLVIEEASARETDRIDMIVTAAALDAWASKRLERAFRENWRSAALIVLDHLEREGINTGDRAKTAQRLLEMGGKRMGLIDLKPDTKTALFRVLEYARAEGLNPREIAKTIREMVPAGRFVNAGPAYRAQLIARTEMLHAQRAATIEALRNSPTVSHVIAFDGDYDEDCAARNGETFTLDDAEVEMMSDTVHPNCTLSFAPKVD